VYTYQDLQISTFVYWICGIIEVHGHDTSMPTRSSKTKDHYIVAVIEKWEAEANAARKPN
jgi:hypothetical protein